CLFVIGWRGEPGKKDEPQHVFQGKVTHQQMEILGIKCFTLSSGTTVGELKKALTEFKEIFSKGQSAAIVVSKGALTSDESPLKFNNNCTLMREQALELILNNTSKETVFVSTTGKTSRELFELREKLANFSDKSNNTKSNNSTLKNKIHEQDFLTVGSMGHASSIALGIALQMPDRQIFCIDGDGAALMHMGAMATIGQSRVKNYVHIVINNGAHESVGGFPTTSPKVDFVSTAQNCGYKRIWSVETETELLSALKEIESDSAKGLQSGAFFLEIKCSQGSRSDLGRPTLSALQNKINFMNMLHN
ncbi:MAG: phosphonopyruvate decarboxylase, partial [Pseudobutyrivibrio ruminis]|nr:phosphonopyruvate decarboxylase [Pseudobutyrivibrio ruminis]